MKIFLPAILLALSAIEALPQGQIVFNNRVLNTVVAPVYGLEPLNPILAKHGNAVTGTPAGAQIYGGAPLAGSGFMAQLFGGPTNVSTTNLQALIPATTFRTSDSAGFIVAPPFAVTIPGVAEDQPATVQLRAWNSQGGTITNWQQVLADPAIARGESLPFTTQPLGGVFVPPPNLPGLESFNLALGVDPSLTIRINFQTNGAPVPAGYLPDVGFVYGNRGNGFAYGWNVDNTSNARDRNVTNSPDQRYDTFISMEQTPGSFWQMAVSNGIYRVYIVAGDPLNSDGVYRIEAEGVLVVHGTPVGPNKWVEGNGVVEVVDGKLTVSNSAGSFNNRICFLEVTRIDAPRLRIPGRTDANSAGFDLTFPGVPGIQYEIQASQTFSNWLAAGTATNRRRDFFELIDPAATDSPQRFYRAQILASPLPSAIYSNDFETAVGPEWSAGTTDITPAGARKFLGQFGRTTASLSLTNLPIHTKVKIVFDLYVIGSWDGSSENSSRDIWELNVTGGPVLLRTTFQAPGGNPNLNQCYPGPYPGSVFPPRTGAVESDTLGYNSDAVYRMSYTFSHSGSAVDFNFVGNTNESPANESWGVDNVIVSVQNDPY